MNYFISQLTCIIMMTTSYSSDNVTSKNKIWGSTFQIYTLLLRIAVAFCSEISDPTIVFDGGYFIWWLLGIL